MKRIYLNCKVVILVLIVLSFLASFFISNVIEQVITLYMGFSWFNEFK